MKEFHRLLEQDQSYLSLLAGVREGRTPQFAVGLANIHKAHIVYSLCMALNKKAHIVAPNEATALRLCEDINAMLGDSSALYYPAREFTFREVEGVSPEYEHARLGVLERILRGEYTAVVSSIEGASQLTIPPETYNAHTAVLKPGDKWEPERICAFLLASGYVRGEQVEGVSQFAVRGGILDLMVPGASSPCRIEFWGDEIDTISAFDIATQRRLGSLESAVIAPASNCTLYASKVFR